MRVNVTTDDELKVYRILFKFRDERGLSTNEGWDWLAPDSSGVAQYEYQNGNARSVEYFV